MTSLDFSTVSTILGTFSANLSCYLFVQLLRLTANIGSSTSLAWLNIAASAASITVSPPRPTSALACAQEADADADAATGGCPWVFLCFFLLRIRHFSMLWQVLIQMFELEHNLEHGCFLNPKLEGSCSVIG